MYLNSLLNILIFCLFCSCSSIDISKLFGGPDNANERNEQLMKDLELDDKYLEKFKEKKKEIKKEIEPPKINLKKKKTISVKKIVKNKTIKKKTKKRIIKKTQKVDVISAPVPSSKKSNKIESPEHVKNNYRKYDENSRKFWSKSRPMFKSGESATYEVSYLGVSTGNIKISVKDNTLIGDSETYHLNARVKTASYYSYLYEVDDICDSYIDIKTIRPLKFSLIQRESSQDIDDLQLFDFDEFKVFTFYKRKTDKKVKKKKSVNPTPYYFQDPLSVLFFIRGLPMKVGVNYDIPIINKGKTEILSARVRKIEKIQTKIGKKKAYRVEIHSKHEGKTIQGGKMLFWFEADDSKLFLKFEAKIKIGRITGEIIDREN